MEYQSRRRRTDYRPETCKRVTYALGLLAQERADRLTRIISNYQNVSKSAVIRGLLRYAERMALSSGDIAVAAVLDASKTVPPESGQIPEILAAQEESKAIWHSLIHEILREQESAPY